MGFLADVATLFRRTPSLTAAVEALPTAKALPASTLPMQSVGVPGGGNFAGRLLFEPNDALRDVSGYGRAGTYTVGEWQSIALSNPFVTAGLDFILAPIADARVDVEAPDKSAGIDEAVAQAQVDFIRWALTTHYRLPGLVEQAARGFLLSGFALFEDVYERVQHESLPSGEGFALRSIEQRLPNSLAPNAWVEDEAGTLVGIKQIGPKGMLGQWSTPTLEARRVLLFSWKRLANNWAGESQLRSVWYIAGKVMPTLLKLVGVSLQREAAGIPTASAVDRETPLLPDQRQQLIDLFANAAFHESSGVVMPAGWKLDWLFSPAANKGHVLDAWKELGLVVLQQLGAQQMVLGTGSSGSRSVGEVHDARAMAFVRKVLSFEESVLNGDKREVHSGLVQRLIDANWGPQKAYPRVKLTPQRPEMQPQEMAAAVASLKGAGLLTVTLADENSVRERLGFAPIDEQQRDVEKAKSAALAPQVQFRPAEGAGEKDVSVASPTSNVRPLKASAQRGGWKPWRPLRASEEKMKLSELDAYFTQRRDDFERAVKPVVVGMLAKAAPAVARAMSDGKVQPAEVAAIPLDTTRLAKVVQSFLEDTRSAGMRSAREELHASKPLRAAAGDEDDRKTGTPDVEDDSDELLDAQQQATVRKMASRLRSELEREAIDALRTGEDAQDVVDRTVARQLDTGAFRGDAGSVVTKVFNIGRDDAARLMGGVAEVELTAILDSATCDACRELDGTTAPFGSAEHDALVPPVRDCSGGDNCRCLLAFIPGDAPAEDDAGSSEPEAGE